MQKKLEQHILQHQWFSKTDLLLVAFSGGVDSLVLAHLLHQLGYKIELAHCNFKLRGQESEGDTEFCQSFAELLSVKIHTNYFDTKQFAKEQGVSTQMAARTLRYNWFNELKKQYNFKAIITAHHANDVIETLFVNLVRGTGINGLQGIPEAQNDIIRPFLFATKTEILNYAKLHGLKYREDSSNVEIKYKRNFIRHQIIPQLRILNPSIEETLNTSIDFFKQSATIVKAFAQQKFELICHHANHQLFISIDLLLLEPQKETLLFEWLYDKGFKTNQIKQIVYSLLSGRMSGKQFLTATHQLVVDRKFLIVQTLSKENLADEYCISSMHDTQHLPLFLSIETTLDKEILEDKFQVKINADVLQFPLTLRRWKNGDKFKPLGMKGFKKLSDFFKDHKFSLFDKKNTWILCDQNQILWLVGYRIDERCKLTNETKNVLLIKAKL